MDELLHRLLSDPVAQGSLRRLFEQALHHFYAFTLVLVRIGGLMTVGPLFGQSIVPAHIRALFVLAVSILVTPLLPQFSQATFHRLDRDGDGRLIREEVPRQIVPRFDRLLQENGRPDDAALSAEEFELRRRLPSTILDYAWIGAGEFALGFVLGLGVLIILTGLQLAGEVIDQQTGLALGEIASPGLEITGSITGQFLFLFGITLLLVMEPWGGHLLMLAALVETFYTLPVGEAFVSLPTVELLSGLVHQSLVLGVQAAAPLLAVMSLVTLTMGFLGHTVPQINVLVIGFPVRVIITLLVVLISLSGIGRSFVDVVPLVIDQLRHSLTGL